jgi:hypothetical protein
VHDIVYAFIGDVVDGQIPQSGILPPDAFHVFPTLCRVPPIEGADLPLSGDDNVELMGPFQVDDAATQVVCCRNFAYLPPKYVSLSSSTGRLRPSRGVRLAGDIQNDGQAEALKPIMSALLLALIRGAVDRPSKWAEAYPKIARNIPLLILHRRQKVDLDLPSLVMCPPPWASPTVWVSSPTRC